MEFRGFIHQHPLKKNEVTYVPILCVACGEFFQGTAYTCSECEFNIHESCLELPQEFQNPYHQHRLTLVTDKWDGASFRCLVCIENHFGFSFHCQNCNFNLDLKCAFQKLTINEGQDLLHHFTHFHPLVATEKRQDNDDGGGGNDNDGGDGAGSGGDADADVSCRICGKPTSGELCGCDPCNFYLHRSCAEFQLPTTLQHFYHPCVLTLSIDKEESNCNACGNSYDFYSYLCEPCNFRIEISCALFPLFMESRGQQQFHHFSHGHPLKLTETNHDDEILCSACQKHCSGQTYVCCSSKCKFFLHNSCFNLPQNILHPFHPHHSLTLYSPIQRQPRPECKVCYRYSSGFTYSCNYCKFDMDVECPVMISPIKYEGHHHNILFVDGQDPCQTDADGDHCQTDADDPCQTDAVDDPTSPSTTNTVLLCSACGTSCKYSTAMFHCVECDYHLHFKCGLLPCSIKQESHLCSLKLTDSPVTSEHEDKDTEVFYCDSCEMERDPRLPVYYCSDGCAYIAEIKCVISEVLLSLSGEYGEVELRSTVFRQKGGKVISKGMIKGIEHKEAWQDSIADSDTEAAKVAINPSLTMKEIYLALPEIEKKEIVLVFACALNNDQNHDRWQADREACLCSDEDYTKFMATMDNRDDTTNLLDPWGNNKRVVNVGNHLVCSDLAPILEDLCAKYGDIIPESTVQNSGLRTIYINTLCEIIRGMCTTRVADISEEKLFFWWRHLKTLQFIGWNVQFAMDRLKRIVHAYYALQVEKAMRKNNEDIDREIKDVSQDIKELEAKLVAQKEKLVTLEEIRKSREPPKPASSSMVAECFREASVLRWMIAGEGLL